MLSGFSHTLLFVLPFTSLSSPLSSCLSLASRFGISNLLFLCISRSLYICHLTNKHSRHKAYTKSCLQLPNRTLKSVLVRQFYLYVKFLNLSEQQKTAKKHIYFMNKDRSLYLTESCFCDANQYQFMYHQLIGQVLSWPVARVNAP